MLEPMRKRPTDVVGESLTFKVPQSLIPMVRSFMREHGIEEERDLIPFREVIGLSDEELHASCLRGARSLEGLTQQQLAKKTGIPKKQISEMENCKRPIDEQTAIKLAEALNTCPQVFLEV